MNTRADMTDLKKRINKSMIKRIITWERLPVQDSIAICERGLVRW